MHTHDISREKQSFDPVLSLFELPLQRTFYPFGFPVQLETNSSEVITAAIEGWGAFTQACAEAPVQICLGVAESGNDVLPPDSAIRSRGHLMSITADAKNFVVCDLERGFAFGWVTQTTAADHPLLRYRFLAPGAGALIEQRAFTALHGALIARNRTGLMLAGDSCAGKSTLAYACARAGWTYISDDAAYFVRSREDRFAVGDPHRIRFRPDAPQLFPELAGCAASVRPNGKMAIQVATRELMLNTADGCRVDHVIYLNREHGRERPDLRHISNQRALEDWSKYNVLGTSQIREARQRNHDRLLTAQLWELRYSDLSAAVERLEQLVSFEC